MAAMDFPASPTDGQVYLNYIYNSAKGAWKAKPLTPGQAQPSATPPTSPNSGDQWYNTNDGNLYVWYNDGDTAQWVQIKSDATLSSTLGNRVTTLETYPAGLVPLIPTSISVSSGTGSVSADGLITFSGTSALSINGVFSSAYNNYRIIHQSSGSSANTGLTINMRAAGTNYTTANQTLNILYWSSATAATNIGGVANQGSLQVGWIEGISSNKNTHSIDLFNPYNTVHTAFTSVSNSYVSSNCSGHVPTTTQYDGLMFGVSGTWSGTVKIYGYR